jgi:hypothetical protein
MIHYAIADAGHFLPAVVDSTACFAEPGGLGPPQAYFAAQAYSVEWAGFAAQTEAGSAGQAGSSSA